jgi:GT2 family glycosyltransferase
MKPDLSIVIVSYNTRQLLKECLDSVYASLAESTLTGQVIVVDNASRDGSAAMVREHFPQVRLIANEENRGFAAANTLFQVFLDFFPLNYRLTDSRVNGRYPRRLYQAGEPFPIDHPLGATLMMRQEVIEQVGLLDERFFIYCEEIDWCLRIKAAGWSIWCVPEAEIVHHVAQSTGQFRDEMFVALWKSRYQLFEKHYSRLFQWMARRIVRSGLCAEVRQARAAAQRGEITESELTSRLTAYRQVREMSD